MLDITIRYSLNSPRKDGIRQVVVVLVLYLRRKILRVSGRDFSCNHYACAQSRNLSQYALLYVRRFIINHALICLDLKFYVVIYTVYKWIKHNIFNYF